MDLTRAELRKAAEEGLYTLVGLSVAAALVARRRLLRPTPAPPGPGALVDAGLEAIRRASERVTGRDR